MHYLVATSKILASLASSWYYIITYSQTLSTYCLSHIRHLLACGHRSICLLHLLVGCLWTLGVGRCVGLIPRYRGSYVTKWSNSGYMNLPESVWMLWPMVQFTHSPRAGYSSLASNHVYTVPPNNGLVVNARTSIWPPPSYQNALWIYYMWFIVSYTAYTLSSS